MREADPLELREEREEVPGEAAVHPVVLLEPGLDAAAPVVRRLVAAPQDPVVGAQPEVVEPVRGVGEALAASPSDRVAPGLGQRLGHQHVVVDRNGHQPQPTQQRRERVRGQHGVPGVHGTRVGAHAHPRAVAGEVADRAVLVHAHAEVTAGPAQSPCESGRLHHGGPPPVPQPAQVRR